jgi:hypothetical protein
LRKSSERAECEGVTHLGIGGRFGDGVRMVVRS